MIRIEAYQKALEADAVSVYTQVFSESPWLEAWAYADVQKSLNDPALRWWMAIDGTRVVGFTAWLVTDNATLAKRLAVPPTCLPGGTITYLAEVGTLKAYRGQGLAKRLNSVGENWGKEEGGGSMVLRTRPDAITYPWYMSKAYNILYRYEDGRVVLGR